MDRRRAGACEPRGRACGSRLNERFDSGAETVEASLGDETGGLRRRVVRGGMFAAGGFVAAQAISFVGFVVLARLAPPATFGEYAAASVLLSAGGLLMDSGMQAAVVQRDDRVQAAASTALLANIVAGLLLGAVAAAFAPLIGYFFHSSDVTRAAAAIAGTIPLQALAIVPAALLQRDVSLRFALLEPATSLTYVAVAIAALASGLGLWGLVSGTYAAACARVVTAWSLARWRPSFAHVSWEMWRSLAKYGRPVVLSSLLREVGISGSTAFVGRALGTADLGRFRAAQRFVLQANLAIVFGSSSVLLPAFSRIRHDEDRLRAAILRALRTLTLVVFPLSVVFIPLGRPIATVVLGEPWRGAGPIMMAMAGIGIAVSLDSVSSEVFKATGRTEFLPRMHGLTAVVPLVLMAILLPFEGVGMGLAMSLGMCLVAAYAIRALAGVAAIPFRRILSAVRPAAGATLAMAVLVFVFDRYVLGGAARSGLDGLGLLVADFAFALVVYVGALLLLSRRALLELRDVASLVVPRRTQLDR